MDDVVDVNMLNIHISEKRKVYNTVDLLTKRSIGAISSREYERRTIINEIYNIGFTHYQTSLTTTYDDPYYPINLNRYDEILAMEIDPKESKFVLVITKFNQIMIYNVSRNLQIFNQVMRLNIPREIEILGILNSVHWLWDGSVFSVGSVDCVHFWDSSTGQMIETVRMRTTIVNHVYAATKFSKNKIVATTGSEGHMFIIDMKYGIVVMTINNIEKCPVKTIDWNPLNEVQFITGNNNGNILLWDTRFQNKYVSRFNNTNESFAYATSHDSPVIGLRFYNDGNNIISVDVNGGIKSWEVKSGRLLPNYYGYLEFCDLHSEFNDIKEYQFAITDNLKEDIAFLPTNAGLKIFDITTGEHLPGSNDVFLPINAATYDSKNNYVYGASNDLIKIWKPQQPLHEIE